MSDSGSLPPPPGPGAGSSFPPPPGSGQQGGWGQPPGQDPGQGGWGQAPGGYGPQAPERNGVALASLICGISSLVCLLLFFLVLTVPLAVVLAIAAIITGILGLRASREPRLGGRGQAIGGIATGAISLVLVAVVSIAAIAAWNTLGFDTSPFSDPEGFLQELEERGVEIDEEGRIDPESIEDLMQDEGFEEG